MDNPDMFCVNNDEAWDYDNVYTSFEDGMNALASGHQRFLSRTEQQIEELKRRRSSLMNELQQHQPSQVSSEHNNVLTLPDIRGYVLSNFTQEKQTGDDSIRIYSADGSVNKNKLFTLKVSKKEETIIAVNLQLSDKSPLCEIKNELNMLSKRNCPSLILDTIQNFMHMNRTRKDIVLKLVTGQKKLFRVFLPQNEKNENTEVCKITALRNDGTFLAVKWTMVWSKVYHGLIHRFTCDSYNEIDEHYIVKYLNQDTFCQKNEKELIKLWMSYQEHLSNSN